MKRIFVKPRNASYQIKQRASSKHVSHIINEDSSIYCGDKLVAHYMKLPDDFTEMAEVFKELKYTTHNRSGGIQTTSVSIGGIPRNPQREDMCLVAAEQDRSPDHYRKIIEFSKVLSNAYKRCCPKEYGKHVKMLYSGTNKVLNRYRIDKTPFTSGIVNRKSAIPYHKDSGNVPGYYSVMIILRDNMTGGDLVLPEFDIALSGENNSLIIFDGQRVIHGVTPIKYISPMYPGYRFSFVLYSRERMWKCLPYEQEIKQYNTRKLFKILKNGKK